MASKHHMAGARARPLSPHLQVYRPQITSVLSITHRLTGIALAFGTVLLVAWLVMVAIGDPAMYQEFAWHLARWWGAIPLFLWSFALFFHLANGIRHLFWDAGMGFELGTVTRSGIATVVAATAMTIGAWALALAMREGQ